MCVFILDAKEILLLVAAMRKKNQQLQNGARTLDFCCYIFEPPGTPSAQII